MHYQVCVDHLFQILGLLAYLFSEKKKKKKKEIKRNKFFPKNEHNSPPET